MSKYSFKKSLTYFLDKQEEEFKHYCTWKDLQYLFKDGGPIHNNSEPNTGSADPKERNASAVNQQAVNGLRIYNDKKRTVLSS
jgi:hypothetical protein